MSAPRTEEENLELALKYVERFVSAAERIAAALEERNKRAR